jgi:hypothetical protein
MGCGCGKKAVSRTAAPVTTVASTQNLVRYHSFGAIRPGWPW